MWQYCPLSTRVFNASSALTYPRCTSQVAQSCRLKKIIGSMLYQSGDVAAQTSRDGISQQMRYEALPRSVVAGGPGGLGPIKAGQIVGKQQSYPFSHFPNRAFLPHYKLNVSFLSFLDVLLVFWLPRTGQTFKFYGVTLLCSIEAYILRNNRVSWHCHPTVCRPTTLSIWMTSSLKLLDVCELNVSG